MNVQKAYGLQQRSTRHTYQRLFLKNKICSFFNCTMGNVEATLCSSDEDVRL